jgi:hypothetical protein
MEWGKCYFLHDDKTIETITAVMKYIIILPFFSMLSPSLYGQELYQMPTEIHTRWASPENPNALKGKGGLENYGRKGRASVRLPSKDTLVLAFESEGVSGTIRRIWMTIREKDRKMLLGLKLNIYWDGAEKPAVSAPIGYFFGMGLGEMYSFESAFFSNPEGRSFNSFVPMPFKNGMKILLINETDRLQSSIFYDVDYTIGDQHGDDMLYFHAFYRREDSTELRRDYEILPGLEGTGRFLGMHIGVEANQEVFLDSWWGEGEVKIYLDGDNENPTLCGTGTEDYVGTAWGQGNYNHLYQGSPFTDQENMRFCFYRYHLPDPVYFYSSIRITIHQIGCCMNENFKEKFKQNGTVLYETGNSTDPADPDNFKGWLFERYGDDWSSCVYFYLDQPISNLPEIQAYEDRIKKIKKL